MVRMVQIPIATSLAFIYPNYHDRETFIVIITLSYNFMTVLFMFCLTLLDGTVRLKNKKIAAS